MTTWGTKCIVGAASALLSQLGFAQAIATDSKASHSPISSEYVDRLIEAGNLPSLSDEGDSIIYNADGLPRSWRFEAFGSTTETGGISRRENGLSFRSRFDTTNYGSMNVDGTFRNGFNSSLLSFWQRGLAFDNDWRANNGAGMINTPSIELARGQYRFYLPTFSVVGVQTEWLHDGNIQIQASFGEPGSFGGLRSSTFHRSGGHILTGGAQWLVSSRWLAGFQFADAQGVSSILDPNSLPGKTSGRSLYGTFAWQGQDSRVQFNVVGSEAGSQPPKIGFWTDGETRDGRYRHNYGLFRLAPGLVWGGYLPFSADILGGYYRVNYQSQRWLWNAGIDRVNAISGQGVDATYGTANIRYQVDRSLGLGGAASVRRARDGAQAANAFVDKQTFLGATRLQLAVASAAGAQRSQEVTVDQTWPSGAGLKLSTSLTLAREISADKRTTRASLALNGGLDLSNSLTLDGSVRIGTDRSDGAGRSASANIGLNWQISARWSMSMTYYDNRREDPPALSASSLLPIPLLAPINKDRSVFLVLRYEDRAGTAVAPLGGAPGSGAGNVIGYLFLDTNNNERRDASEAGAANVTILLDGKFSTRTDSQGKFEFPLVTAGTHTISVIADNLPLPYYVGGEEKRQVVVRTRETTLLDIAASNRK